MAHFDLKNKTVIITGAANGLGKALAAEFYRQGCHLALLDLDGEGLEKARKELDTGGQKITVHRADVSVEAEITAAWAAILEHHQHIDILVNNAGISISRPFEETDPADYKRLFDVNFWGTVHCTRHFLPEVKKQGSGRIVNIISDFAFMGFPGKTAYGSSKSAVLGFTNALKTELARTGVKVCYVVPPPLDTGLVKNSIHIDDEKRRSEARFLEKHGLPPDRTARKIVGQIRTGKFRIIVGAMMFGIDLAARFFPTWLHHLVGKNRDRFDFI